jgi:hypothetical protein
VLSLMISLVALLVDSYFENGHLQPYLLMPDLALYASDTLDLPFKYPTIFRGSSVDYGPKSIYGSKWNPFGDGQVGNMVSPIINRNLQSLGYVSINS